MTSPFYDPLYHYSYACAWTWLVNFTGKENPTSADITDEIVPVLVDVLKTLMPILVQIIQQVLPVVLNLVKLITPILSTLLTILSPILGAVLQLLAPLLELVSAILTPILKLLNVILEPLLMILNTILVPLINISSMLTELLSSILSAVLEPMLGLLGEIIAPLLQILNACLTPIFQALEQFYAWITPIGVKAWNWLKGFFNFVIDNLKNGVSDAFNKVANVVTTVWETMKTAFKNGVNFWIKAINTLIEGANKLDVPDWVTKATGIKGVNLEPIPMLAEGGEIQRSGSVLVGENGPELLNLPNGASVTPLDKTGVDIDYNKLANALVSAFQTAGIGNITMPIYVGGEFFETAVVNALNSANYRSGGR